MTDDTALSRGDRNRCNRLARLRALLPTQNATVGVDLADDKQAAVVADHACSRCWCGGLLRPRT